MAAVEIPRSSALCSSFLSLSRVSVLPISLPKIRLRAWCRMGSRWVTCILSCAWILLTLVPPCRPEATVSTVKVHAARDLMCNERHRYLDVRTVEEFNKGHPEDAINVPYMFFTPEGRVKNKDFIDQVSKVCSKDDYIVVGCASGVRSLQATQDLLNDGFKHAKNMGGGFAAWTENGFAIKKPQSLL